MARGKIFTNRKQKVDVGEEKGKKSSQIKKKDKKSKGAKKDDGHPKGGGDYFDPKTGVVFSTKPEDSCVPLMEANITKFLKDKGQLDNPEDHVTVALHVIDYLSGDTPTNTPYHRPLVSTLPPITQEDTQTSTSLKEPLQQEKEKMATSGVATFWQEVNDPKTNHAYYWNPTTNEVSWTLPPNGVLQSEAAERSDQIQDPENEIEPIKIPTEAQVSMSGGLPNGSAAQEELPIAGVTNPRHSKEEIVLQQPSLKKTVDVPLNAKDTADEVKDIEIPDEPTLSIDEISKKIEYLNKEQFPNIEQLSISFQTRVSDWKQGGLPSEYFVSKLKETEQNILLLMKERLLQVASSDWEPLWDSGTAKFYFKNLAGGSVQWEWPTFESNTDNTSSSEQVNVHSEDKDSTHIGQQVLLPTYQQNASIEKDATPPIAPLTIEQDDDMDIDSNSSSLPQLEDVENTQDEKNKEEHVIINEQNTVHSLYSDDLPLPSNTVITSVSSPPVEEVMGEEEMESTSDQMILTELEAANQEALMRARLLEKMKNNTPMGEEESALAAEMSWKPLPGMEPPNIDYTDSYTIEKEEEKQNNESSINEVTTTQVSPSINIEPKPAQTTEENEREEEMVEEIKEKIKEIKEKITTKNEKEEEKVEEIKEKITTKNEKDKDYSDRDSPYERKDEYKRRNKSSKKSSRYYDSDSDLSDDYRYSSSSRRRRSRDRHRRSSRKSRRYSDDSDYDERYSHRRSHSKGRKESKRKKDHRKKKHRHDSSSDDEKDRRKRRYRDISTDEERERKRKHRHRTAESSSEDEAPPKKADSPPPPVVEETKQVSPTVKEAPPTTAVAPPPPPPLEKSFVPARFKPKGKTQEEEGSGQMLSQTQVEMIHNIASATGYPMMYTIDPAQYNAAYAYYTTAPTTGGDIVANSQEQLSYDNSQEQQSYNSQEQQSYNSQEQQQQPYATVEEQPTTVTTTTTTTTDDLPSTPLQDDNTSVAVETEIKPSTPPIAPPPVAVVEEEKNNDQQSIQTVEDDKKEDIKETEEIKEELPTPSENNVIEAVATPTADPPTSEQTSVPINDQRDMTPPLQDTTPTVTTTTSQQPQGYTISAPSTPYPPTSYTTDPSQAAYAAAYASMAAYSPYYAQMAATGMYPGADQSQYAAAMNYYAAYQAAAYGAYYQQATVAQQPPTATSTSSTTLPNTTKK